MKFFFFQCLDRNILTFVALYIEAKFNITIFFFFKEFLFFPSLNVSINK